MLRGLQNICHATITPLPGATVNHIVAYLQDMCDPKPVTYHTLIVWVGTNNSAQALEDTKEEFICLLQFLKQQCQGVNIALQSILPRPRDDNTSRVWVQQINRWLAGACKRNHFKFFKVTGLVQSREGILDHTLFRDGLHLNSRGLSKIQDSLKTRLTRWFFAR